MTTPADEPTDSSPAVTGTAIPQVIVPGTQWAEFADREIVDWKRIRSALEHENELTHHRQTWLLTSQGFLFAAFGIVFTAAAKKDVEPDYHPLFIGVLVVIVLVGIATSWVLQKSIHFAEEQHEELREWWMRKYGREDAVRKPQNPPKGDDRHPPIAGAVHSKLAPSVLPWLFIGAWGIGLVLDFFLAGFVPRVAAITMGIVVGVIVACVGSYRLGASRNRPQSGRGT